MTEYTAFLSRVIPFVRECPENVAIDAIRNATIEFCERSHWLHYRHDPITLLEGIAQYELEPPDEHDIVGVLDMWLNGKRLTPTVHDDLVRAFGDDYSLRSGTPQFYTTVDPIEVTFVDTPDRMMPNAVTALVALAPGRDSFDCNDTLYQRFLEPIAQGALHRLKDMEGMPWSNPNQALRHRALYVAGITAATVARQRGGNGVRAERIMRPGRSFL